MIALPPNSIARILAADPGRENEVNRLQDLLYENGALEPWIDLGLASSDAVITSRGGLFVVVYEVMTGSWKALQQVGPERLCSIALLHTHPQGLTTNIVPAVIDFLQVSVENDVYRGRLDIKLLGEGRTL